MFFDFFISKNIEIFGVCGVVDNYVKVDKYGWIVVDFFVYKVGCYGFGCLSDYVC